VSENNRISAAAVGGRPLLELTTQLVEVPEQGWVLQLYQGAAEASGAFQWNQIRRRVIATPTARDQSARSMDEAGRRARGRLRRYCAHNRLNRLGTLTYAGEGCFDQGQVRRDLGEFFRGLRELVGRPFPYAWVPEWHKDHGLHAHFAVGRYIRHSVIEEAWGRGLVHIKLLGNVPIGSGALGESRQAARYLAKYVGKALAEGRELGRHRFDVAQGFAPSVDRIKGANADEVLAVAVARMGGPPSVVWRSRDMTFWLGFPAVWASWDA
jgi:hypothetical protein